MDLQALFGRRYVVTLDESWAAESPGNRAAFKADGSVSWYYEIKGRYGMVYPYSESAIAARVTPRIGKKLKAVLDPELAVFEDSIEALGFRTDMRNLRAILRAIKPRRLYQLPEDQRQIRAAHMAAIRFRKEKNINKKCTSGALPGPIASAAASTAIGTV